MMDAKQLFLDFLDTVFLLGISIFMFFYFIVGNNLGVAKHIIEILTPLVYFSIFFFIKIKFLKKDYRKFVKEDNLEEIIFYITKNDKLLDKAVIFLLGIAIVLISKFTGGIYIEDIVQSVSIISFLLIWHFYLFRKHESINKLPYINRFDQILDQIMVFASPIFIYIIALSFGDADMVDLVQSLSGFGIFYLWRKYMYKF